MASNATHPIKLHPIPQFPSIVLALAGINTITQRYHWYFFVPDQSVADTAEESPGLLGTKYHVTNTGEAGELTPWRYESSRFMLASSASLMAAAVIPISLSPEDAQQQSFTCRTWVREAMRRLTDAKITNCFDIDELEREMLSITQSVGVEEYNKDLFIPAFAARTGTGMYQRSMNQKYNKAIYFIYDLSSSQQILSATHRTMAPTFLWLLLSRIVKIIPARLRFHMWFKLRGLSRRYWNKEPTPGIAHPIFDCLYLKSAPSELLTREEAHIMQFVRKNTSIPVPIVIDNIVVNDRTCIVMTALPGGQLWDRLDNLNGEQTNRIVQQMSEYLDQLCIIPSSFQEEVCGFDRGPLRCQRLCYDARPRGPYTSIQEFHSDTLKRSGIQVPPDAQHDEEAVWGAIRESHSRPHKVVFTHNDLGPHNILVDKDCNVTGIIDWEYSVWYPEYWKFIKSTFLWQFHDKEGPWFKIMHRVFPQYTLE
ncbi:hypothetical protein AX16_009212 [Volvariella volvacea WC 439]|nr:hypothetical protein AX16_009212 [Volvariella volvacea WC 439]